MKQLDRISKWLGGIFKHTVFQAVISVIYIFIFLTMALYLISVTFEFEVNVVKSGRFMYLVLIGLFIIPLGLKEIFREGDGLTIWGRRTFNWIYWGTIILTGLSGATWYLVPSNPRLEPATMLLGFAVATISFSRNQEGQGNSNTST